LLDHATRVKSIQAVLVRVTDGACPEAAHTVDCTVVKLGRCLLFFRIANRHQHACRWIEEGKAALTGDYQPAALPESKHARFFTHHYHFVRTGIRLQAMVTLAFNIYPV
jgi:hypothetical protein